MGDKSRELHGFGAGESSASTTDTNTSFAKPSTTKWMVAEMLLSSCQFSSLVFKDCCLKFSEKTKTELFWAISVSSKRNTKSNHFELVLLRETCQRNHVLNYTSGNSLTTKQYTTFFELS